MMVSKDIIIFVGILVVLVFGGAMAFIALRPSPQPPITQPSLEKPEIDTSTTSTSSVQDWQIYRNEKYG